MDTSFSQAQVDTEREEDETESDGDSRLQFDTDYDEAGQNQPEKEKGQRKPRRPATLPTEIQVVTAISADGVPIEPLHVARTYNTSIGLIVRQGVRITCKDLRSKDNKILMNALLDKLFCIYKFEFEGAENMKKRIEDKAMSMMAKALRTWRNMAHRNKDKDFNTFVRIRWPKVQEEDWKQFIAYHSDPGYMKLSEWGKEMRKKNQMNHMLGSRGYAGKEKVWEKEDLAEVNAGRQKPFSYISRGRGRNFVRARAKISKETGQPIFSNPLVEELHDTLVSS